MVDNKNTSLVEGLEMMRGINRQPVDSALNKYLSVSVDAIIPNEQQPRGAFEQRQLQELSDSIKQQGIINPITVKIFHNDKYKIIAGERRWRAAKLAGLTELMVIKH
jgi:ParB family chromosome partitioning protein